MGGGIGFPRPAPALAAAAAAAATFGGADKGTPDGTEALEVTGEGAAGSAAAGDDAADDAAGAADVLFAAMSAQD